MSFGGFPDPVDEFDLPPGRAEELQNRQVERERQLAREWRACAILLGLMGAGAIAFTLIAAALTRSAFAGGI